ncbi:MAG: AAA family ATPase [Patescibacteria group bacterium]
MMELEKPKIVVFCGKPLSGKSTIAKAVAEQIGAYLVDIDDNVRTPLVGMPHPHPNKFEELMQNDRLEMAAAYDLLFATIQTYMARLKRSLVVTATFSRKAGGQDRLLSTWDSYKESVDLRVLWCNPRNFDDAEVLRRLASRSFGVGGYIGGVNSLERVREVEARFEPIMIPHIALDTSSPENEHACIVQALDYILN